ncbi:TonB-dependent receptor [Sphingomonas sp.]|uniref:TonB-dependent receptor plug domain-containing protein n=1 Tax=Sphingomonas sp. TaxID=28214 RepID=UPI001ED63FB4|nr:TonB-dependent receptor [Sphingomonas sp.]MBX3593192.1 TonB-dependent receptor [Sphingomonas sp.]
MKFNRLLAATALASTFAITPQVAFAQTASDTAASSEGEEAPTTAGETKEGEIVVVGSRIRRSNLTTADPIQVITREETTSAGFNSTAEILQSAQVTGGTSQINNSFGGFVTAGGPGANTVSLRGLGTTRTLVLLNGRRIAPAGSRGQVGAADLTVLPNAILDRVEVLNTGASSIYGSDAVAGVINLVTRDDIKGVVLEAQHNVPEIGAGVTRRYSAVFGTRFEGFKIAGSVEYYNRDAVKLGDLDFTRCQRALRSSAANPAFGSADLIDARTGQPKCFGEISVTGDSGVTVNTIGTRDYAGTTVALAPGIPAGYGTLPTSAGYGTIAQQVCNRFRPNAAVTTGALPGYECVGGGLIPTGLRDTLPRNFFLGDVVSPGEQFNGYLQASLELPGLNNAEVYTEIMANRRKSKQTSGSRQLTIDYPLGSPLYSATQFPGQFLPAQAGGITGTNAIGVRAFTEYGPYENRQTVDFIRGLIGVRGDLFGDWRYDASVMRSWSDSTYETDTVLTDKIAQSLDVVSSGGTLVCRNTLNGCVAAPSLSANVVNGIVPQAWFDFISETTVGHTKYRETIANLTFDGSLFKLPGGPLSVALGVEYRKARIDDTPSRDSQANNLYGLTSSGITRGTDSVKEAFGEIEAPILADVPFFYRLTLNASGRYTDYKSYGSQWTYKIGGLWAPAKFLSFRGSYGTSYRAPALFEQFLGPTSGFQSQNNDPCNSYGTRDATSNRYINCQSLGLPTTYTATSSIRVNQQGGAATGLSAETSRAYTFGGVFEPNLGSFGRFSFGVDYFNVLVENGVSQLTYLNILSTCYDSAPADFKANQDTCALIQRAATAPYGLTVTTGYVNISNAAVSGIDFTARYQVPVFGGTFRLNAAVTKYDQRYSQTLPTDTIRNTIGAVNNPEWTGTFDASFKYDRFTLRYGVEWLDGTNTSAFQLGTTDATRATYYFQTPDYFTHSASVRYQGDKFGLVLGVRNLTNAALPQISSGAYNRIGNVPLYSGYDYIGRTFFVNVTTAF